MINKEEMLRLISIAYPGFRKEMVKSADSWITDDLQFLYYVMISPLSSLLLSNIDSGNYDHVDELFETIEKLLKYGTQEVQELVACGFLESLQNQGAIHPKLWAPLLGPGAVAFCKSRDEYHGIDIQYYKSS